jgi:hypothetical protein
MDARCTHQLLLTKCEKACNLFRIEGPVHFREPLSVTPAVSPPSLTWTDPFLSPRSLLAAARRSAADSGPVIRVGFAPLRRTILGEARRSAAEPRKVVRVQHFRIGAGRRATTESRPGISDGFAREETDHGPRAVVANGEVERKHLGSRRAGDCLGVQMDKISDHFKG